MHEKEKIAKSGGVGECGSPSRRSCGQNIAGAGPGHGRMGQVQRLFPQDASPVDNGGRQEERLLHERGTQTSCVFTSVFVVSCRYSYCVLTQLNSLRVGVDLTADDNNSSC